MANEEEHDLALLHRQLQPDDHLFGHAHALERMIVIAPLADIVQQQRQDQQFGRGQIRQDRAKPLP
jgi:hypothetical protein